ncbi:MAG TPA: DUF6311 domain-containing protein [Rhodanobacteraceae bacterium]|jgi:hypothetical protein|nr:DUF6311 domain-containing protein [Rhodanobacteraceae bacterium]
MSLPELLPANSRAASFARFDTLLYALLCILLAGDAIRVLFASLPAGKTLAPSDAITVVVATCVLIALGWIALRRGGAQGALAFAIGATAGLLFYVRTLGLALADPTATGWIMTGDWAQHYSGWAMFRHAPWHWPPGAMPEVSYPVGTSIVYTDSLPLLAFFFKPFSAWLPEPFQYIGFWFLVNFTLQGGFGALLVTRVTRAPAAVVAAAALFVCAPVLLFRIGHDTLTAHWLLLAALWLYSRTQTTSKLAAEAWPWWSLTAIAALVHPYLAAMTLAIQAAAWWKRVHIDDARSIRQIACAFGISLVVAMAMWWLCGAMILRAADTSGGIVFGYYSLNLLAFVNPMNASNLLPTFGVPPGQVEGFAYLGVGVLALLAILLVDLVRERRVAGVGREWLPLAVVAAVSLVFAVGALIAFGPWTLLDLTFKSRLLGLFRSSGRFVWIAYYALMLLAMIHVLRRFAPTTASVLLGAALLLQVIDLSAWHARVANVRQSAGVMPKKTELNDPRWKSLATGRSHLTLLPPLACSDSPPPYLPMQLFAAANGMTFNSGYLARWDGRATGRYCEVLERQLAEGAWSADDLYVIGPDWKTKFHDSAPAARCEDLDGYEACVVDGSKTP